LSRPNDTFIPSGDICSPHDIYCISDSISRRLNGDFAYKDLGESITARTIRVHLAVMNEPYLTYILDGSKTIESRFSINRCPPHGAVARGDLILFKASGGPIIGIGRASWVETLDLNPDSWTKIRDRYLQRLRITDEFLEEKQGAAYATLIGMQDVRTIDPFGVAKKDRRGWVVLGRPLQCTFPALA
jgi:hypothetical protein